VPTHGPCSGRDSRFLTLPLHRVEFLEYWYQFSDRIARPPSTYTKGLLVDLFKTLMDQICGYIQSRMGRFEVFP